ncbi:MAG: hypothetical protein M0Q38_04755 [Bacteroidales bacterium]|jgi:hypothetical protein|nr:hypothetical protein [Bacteroidales bacterium]
MTYAKKLILLILLAIIFLHAFQKVTHFFTFNALNGYFESVEKPQLSLASLWSGEYQEKMNRHLDQSVGMREWLVRLYNQLDFSLFSVSHARQVVVGKQDYLFEEPYIDAWLGRDFIGKRSINARVNQIRRLQDLLWKRNRTLLVVVFPPDKGTFYPEKIPDRYLKKSGTMTNYQWYKRKFEESKVNFIDFNEWFLKMKDTSRYMLYPKTGIHWSSYGAFLAFDSLTRYIGAHLNKPLIEIKNKTIQLSETTRGRDADIDEGLNLIWDISHPPLAYPSVIFRKKPNTVFPRALFIGDSFYFTLAEGGYIANTFANRDFWYYDQDVYVGSYNTEKKTQALNLQDQLAHMQVIILLQTNAGYGNVGYGFVDRLLNTLDSVNRMEHSITH